MAEFRYHHIKSDTIAVLKDSNYETYSKKSISWLRTLGDNTKHALNGCVQTILGRKVYVFDKTTNTVYQFHGCFWHDCPYCYKDDTINNKIKKARVTFMKNKTFYTKAKR
jgi:G:T-mismatch repair DNA endonuclease (very short patch repair protein)